MAMTKEARDEILTKIAEAEARDREQAFEAGFAKAAADLQLDADGYRTLYQIGCEQLAANKA